MRQKTINLRNQGSFDKKIDFFSQTLSHIPRWVRLEQKTPAKNSHAWAPLRLSWMPCLKIIHYSLDKPLLAAQREESIRERKGRLSVFIFFIFFIIFKGLVTLCHSFWNLLFFLTFIHTIQSHSVHPSPFAEARSCYVSWLGGSWSGGGDNTNTSKIVWSSFSLLFLLYGRGLWVRPLGPGATGERVDHQLNTPELQLIILNRRVCFNL